MKEIYLSLRRILIRHLEQAIQSNDLERSLMYKGNIERLEMHYENTKEA